MTSNDDLPIGILQSLSAYSGENNVARASIAVDSFNREQAGRLNQHSCCVIALIHWRIKPEREHIEAFLAFWRTQSIVEDRTGLIGEFLSETLSQKDFPHITWHIDPDRLDDHKSFVNVGTWADEKAFHEQIGKNFNDDRPILPFEKYRRLRIVLRPKCWRMGQGQLPVNDSVSVL